MPFQYTDLRDEISFVGVEFDKWFIHEPFLLEPRLRAAGFTEIKFMHGHKDLETGVPLTRRCDAKNSHGRWKHFFYSATTTTKES